MILCFGTFAKVLSCCKQILPQDKFVPRLAWVVDRMNSCLGVKLTSEDTNDNLDIDAAEGNPAVVSKLLSCSQRFELRDKPLPSVEVASHRFKSAVMPHINEDKVAKAVLAILYIISKDASIEDEHRESFRKYVGIYGDELLKREKFDVPDFLTRILLYTTCVDNKEGRSCVGEITDDFIDKVAKDNWAELKWDATTQVVEIKSSEERRLFEELYMISDMRFALFRDENKSLMELSMDTSWLGINKHALFPNVYRDIEFKNPETKELVRKKIMRYANLVCELKDRLVAKQQSTKDRVEKWPVFPDERMRHIRQQLEKLSNELIMLSSFPDR